MNIVPATRQAAGKENAAGGEGAAGKENAQPRGGNGRAAAAEGVSTRPRRRARRPPLSTRRGKAEESDSEDDVSLSPGEGATQPRL